ncbi:hypothetical protein BDV06DRAFT_27218 [Aspergillus oleicola]
MRFSLGAGAMFLAEHNTECLRVTRLGSIRNLIALYQTNIFGRPTHLPVQRLPCSFSRVICLGANCDQVQLVNGMKLLRIRQ